MFDDVLTIETYPTVLDHGSLVEDRDGTPTVVTVRGCDAQPGMPQEMNLPRADLDRVAWTVYCPPGTTIVDNGSVRLNGGADVYRLMGMPAVWGSGAHRLDHVVVYLERWVG